jgi:hypothetical protein
MRIGRQLPIRRAISGAALTRRRSEEITQMKWSFAGKIHARQALHG